MNSPWLIGRYCSAVAITLATLILFGCDLPISLLSAPLGTGAGNGKKVASVASQVEESDKAKAATDEENVKEELPPAEDLVKDWPKPDVTLFVTGRQHGYIEPCGCTGLDNQKGGLMRRHSVQKLLLDRGWDLICLDAGNQVRRFGQQPVIKLQKTYESLCSVMKYDVIGFGPDDLKLGTGDLLQTILNAQNEQNPFTCANVFLCGDDSGSFTNTFRVIEKNGKRIGVTAILGDEHFAELKGQSDLQLVDMKKALAQVVPQMQAQKCDFMVLIGQTSEENCIALAKQFPVFDLVITTSSAGDPWFMPQQIRDGNHVTQMIQVGVKGMYVGLVGLYSGADGKRLKYERVPLDHRFKDSRQIKEVFRLYQKELESLFVSGNNQDIHPREHSSGYKFVGSESCNECHDEEYSIWEEGVDMDGEGPHFRATMDLIHPPNSRGDIPRNFDPECLSCHVTGWNPQDFFPYKTGYMNVSDKKLYGNGCENCHGPGSAHIAAEKANKDQQLMEKLRLEVRVTMEQAKTTACRECHDADNSPDFLKDGAFDKYWDKIKHGENW